MPRYRNRIALNPLLRKGGAHERNRTALRREARNHLDTLVYDWYKTDCEDDQIKHECDDKVSSGSQLD